MQQGHELRMVKEEPDFHGRTKLRLRIDMIRFFFLMIKTVGLLEAIRIQRSCIVYPLLKRQNRGTGSTIYELGGVGKKGL